MSPCKTKVYVGGPTVSASLVFFSEQNISELSRGSIRKRESFLTAENQQYDEERKKLKEESETAVDHTIYI